MQNAHGRTRHRSLAIVPLAMAGTAAVLALGAGAAWAAPSPSGTPSTNLKDGSTIAVKGTGFGPNTNLFIVQCSGTAAESCDTARLVSTVSDAAGNVSAKLTVHTGAIGNGTCAAGSKNCIVAVTDLSKQYVGFFPLAFAAASAPAPSKSPAVTPTSKPATGKTATPAVATSGGGSVSGSGSGTPVSVAAGSGGNAGRQGPDVALALALAVGGSAVAAGTVRQYRRRRPVQG